MDPQCPWAGVAPATIHYCENNLCGWIAQPANAWSNLGFVAVGLGLIWAARRSGARSLRLFGPIAIFVGLTSFAYHASFSFVGQVFDLGSMYCMSALLIVMNLRRLDALAESKVVPVFVATVVASVGLVAKFKVVGIPIFASEIALALWLEWRAHTRSRGAIDYRPFLAALGIFAVAFGIWILDFERVFCDPDRHWLSGHALWHVLDALVFVALYRFYAQFQGAAEGSIAPGAPVSAADIPGT